MDPDIPLGMDVGSPDDLFVDIVGETVYQRDKKPW
jgi:hypothetical protein